MLTRVDASLRRLAPTRSTSSTCTRRTTRPRSSETVHALADLVRSGKIRYFGVSNYRAWRVAEICRLCDAAGIDRPVVSQPLYNALNRMSEVEHLPACTLSASASSPTARSPAACSPANTAPDCRRQPGTRAGRQDKRILETEWRPESLHIAANSPSTPKARSITPGQFAIAWVLNNRLVTGVITGPRTEAQWEDYVAALDCKFTAADEALVDRLVTTGHASTPGYNDPSYPIEGRVPR